MPMQTPFCELQDQLHQSVKSESKVQDAAPSPRKSLRIRHFALLTLGAALVWMLPVAWQWMGH
jgi:hypothetical protein